MMFKGSKHAVTVGEVLLALVLAWSRAEECSYVTLQQACLLDGGTLFRDVASSECTTTTTSTVSTSTASTMTATTSTTTLSFWFNCSVAYNNWEVAWSDMKKTWCCSEEQRGCPSGPTSTTTWILWFNCSIAYGNWELAWSDLKKSWCCSKEQRGCPPVSSTTKTQTLTRISTSTTTSSTTRSQTDTRTTTSSSTRTSTTTQSSVTTSVTSTTTETISFDCFADYNIWEDAWSQKKKDWCCLTMLLGCPTTSTFTSTQTKITSTATSTHISTATSVSTMRSSTTKTSSQSATNTMAYSTVGPTTSTATTTEWFDCASDAHNWELAWSAKKKDWCCRWEQIACPSTTATTATRTSVTTSSRSTTATTTASLTRTTSTSSSGTSSTTTHTTSSATTTTTITQWFDCDADYNMWEQAWSDMKTIWCCQRFERGCPSTTSSTLTRTSRTSSSMTTSSTSTLVTSTWSTTTFTGTSTTSSSSHTTVTYSITTTTITTATITTSIYFDCVADYYMWELAWSDDKKEWCCQSSLLGCPPTSSSTGTLTSRTTSSRSATTSTSTSLTRTTSTQTHSSVTSTTTITSYFDCEADFENWQEGWSSMKKAWCCRAFSRGCPSTSSTTQTETSLTTSSSSTSTKTGTTTSSFVSTTSSSRTTMTSTTSMSSTTTLTSSTATQRTSTATIFFDCSIAYHNRAEAWSELKKAWCCRKEQVDCTSTTATTETQTKTATTSSNTATSTSQSWSSSTTGTETVTSQTNTVSFTSTLTATATTTEPPALCRRFFAGVPLVGGACPGEDSDQCLLPGFAMENPEGPCGTQDAPAELLCPAKTSSGGAVSADPPGCRACATLLVQDWESRGYTLSGEVKWGPEATCQSDESAIDGYSVWLVDECGSKLDLVGNVTKKEGEWLPSMLECCHPSWYSLFVHDMNLPEAAVGFLILAYQGQATLAGPLLPIFRSSVRTATATTTTTVVPMTSPRMVQLQGVMLMSVSDVSVFEDARNASVLEQASKETLVASVGELALPDQAETIQVNWSASSTESRRLRRLPEETPCGPQEGTNIQLTYVWPLFSADLAQTKAARLQQQSRSSLTVLMTGFLRQQPALVDISVSVQCLSTAVVDPDFLSTSTEQASQEPGNSSTPAPSSTTTSGSSTLPQESANSSTPAPSSTTTSGSSTLPQEESANSSTPAPSSTTISASSTLPQAGDETVRTTASSSSTTAFQAETLSSTSTPSTTSSSSSTTSMMLPAVLSVARAETQAATGVTSAVVIAGLLAIGAITWWACACLRKHSAVAPSTSEAFLAVVAETSETESAQRAPSGRAEPDADPGEPDV